MILLIILNLQFACGEVREKKNYNLFIQMSNDPDFNYIWIGHDQLKNAFHVHYIKKCIQIFISTCRFIYLIFNYRSVSICYY